MLGNAGIIRDNQYMQPLPGFLAGRVCIKMKNGKCRMGSKGNGADQAPEATAEKLTLLYEGIQQLNVGVSIFDAGLLLVTFNHRYLELLDLTEEVVHEGMHLATLLRHLAERGDYGDADIDELVQKAIEPLHTMTGPLIFERRSANGTILEVNTQQLQSGGYITIHTDITRRKQREEELLHSEKLAALGGLVAAIAHDLNTPIGNTLMVASTLHQQTREINKSLATGLKKSMLEAYLADANSATDMMMLNLYRAGELISSFKQVAVDQTSSERRPFRLKEFVNEILITLRPTLRTTPYTVESNIPDNIRMDSFPGPLGQVITNFINNAILHAFDGSPHGTVRIEVRQLDETHIEMKVSDDGKGIPKEHMDRIFDPFFTTKRGKGGSGIGLSIVYTSVTGVLGGSLAVESEVGRGTTFTLVLPNVAPAVAVAVDP